MVRCRGPRRGHTDLYLLDKPHLKLRGTYLDLPRLVESITGITPDHLWAILFALYLHWLKVELGDVTKTPGALNVGTYFTKNCSFSVEESTRFFDLVATDARDLKSVLSERGFGPGNLRPYDLLEFEDRPLVIVDGRAYCVSVTLLFRKLIRGLHHIFLNRIAKPRDRQDYLTYIGEVFDDYVNRLLSRCFPKVSGRFIDGAMLRDRIGDAKKACDGVILYPQSVLLLEAKATLLPLEVRRAGDWDGYVSKIGDIFGDAAEQFGDTIEAIENGALRDLAVDPKHVTEYLPVVVTLEQIPMNVLVYEEIEKEIARRGGLQQAKVKPFQVLDVSELEFLEVAVHGGVNLRDLFFEKISDATSRYISLGNYCIQKEHRFANGHNPYLKTLVDELERRTLDLFRERSRDNEGVPPED